MTTATITGPIYSVSQVYDFVTMRIVFELSHWDQEEDVGLFATGPKIVPVDQNGDFSVDLFVNTQGTQQTHYQCFLVYRRTDGAEWIREPIGIFTLTSPGTFRLSNLGITPIENKVTSTLDVYSRTLSMINNIEDVFQENLSLGNRVINLEGILTSGANYSLGGPVDMATTSNISLSGEKSIDGILTNNSRVLVKNQTNDADNGIYVSSSGAWSRAVDMNQANEVQGTLVFVNGGTAYSGSRSARHFCLGRNTCFGR